MISYKSIINFFIVNFFLLIMGTVNYFILTFFQNCYVKNIVTFFVTIQKNYMLITTIDKVLQSRDNISDDHPTESYVGEFHVNVLMSSIIESVCVYQIGNVLQHSMGYIDLIYFIPVSFIFEIMFDLFHYITHRIMHHNFFYKYSHKKHHKFPHPSSITTYYQHSFDIIITNVIPTFLTLYIMSQYICISYYMFTLINMYKTYIEIAGHCGKHLVNTASFPQFIWLPRIFNIELHTKDHDLHHSINNCNYAKRFSLWDKLFGTFKYM